MDVEKILKQIDEMTPEEAAEIVRQALQDAGIPFEDNQGQIHYDGLPIPSDEQ